jgi:ABC-type multidrug transport system ATPase subunit
MPIRPEEFDQAANSLKPVLHGLPAVLVAIDGRDGAGKTTLGRFLAWYFNITLVETDLFLHDGKYQSDVIRSIIDWRLSIPRPVIVEGITLRELLSNVGRAPDFSIYVVNPSFDGSFSLAERLDRYDAKYQPMRYADHVLRIEHA